MSLDSPISTAIPLDIGEKNLNSFLVTECEKGCFGGYKLSIFSRSICHVTSNRLIFEPYKISQAEKFLAKGLLSLAAKYADPATAFQQKVTTKMAMAKSDNASCFFIPYSEIKSFSLVKPNVISGKTLGKIHLKAPPKKLGDDGLVFAIAAIPNDTFSRYVSSKALHKEFVASASAANKGI